MPQSGAKSRVSCFCSAAHTRASCDALTPPASGTRAMCWLDDIWLLPEGLYPNEPFEESVLPFAIDNVSAQVASRFCYQQLAVPLHIRHIGNAGNPSGSRQGAHRL